MYQVLHSQHHLPGSMQSSHQTHHLDGSNSYERHHGGLFHQKLPPILNRPPTPPPDYMGALATEMQRGRHEEQHQTPYDDWDDGTRSMAAMLYSKTLQRDAQQPTQERLAAHSQQRNALQSQQPKHLESWHTRPAVSQSKPSSPSAYSHTTSAASSARKPSTAQTIAPALQIPPTVNSSRGSLAELAAQITCLFWFETSDVLDAAERSHPSIYPDQLLAHDAIPSTGFRKWVTTILSTTQVAQNVVILGLLFIYRLKKQNPLVKGKLGSEYRLLTVALMLGNKFLDDNTYTNKTWAEVSGISVTEVHIMEVEFLSNMKYNLFTSAAEWSRWQTLLGRFASFIDRASRPAPVQPTPLLKPLWTAFSPSPPSSAQLSPTTTMPHSGSSSALYTGPSASLPQPQSFVTRTTTPQDALATSAVSGTRKRSLDEGVGTQPSKRTAYSTSRGDNHRRSNSNASSNSLVSGMSHNEQRMHYPARSAAASQPVSTNVTPNVRYQLPQLPPIMIPNTQAMSHVPSGAWSQSVSNPSAVPSTSSPMPNGQLSYSRHYSPYSASRGHSPMVQYNVQTPSRPSSSAIMYQRNSPYKAVREVSTLLVPPPSRALHQPEHVSKDQMHYQPLGRPIWERQQGRLPYVAQNQWFDDNNGHKTATPVEQWPCFFNGPQAGYAWPNGSASGRRE